MQFNLLKKISSYIFPITIETIYNAKNSKLVLKLYCNELILYNTDAIYSQGKSYEPFTKTFATIKSHLPEAKTFLLLGTGLGSALKILQSTYGIFPESTLVDIDEDTLYFSQKYMSLNTKNNVSWTCENAIEFVKKCTLQYDIIGVDIFYGTRVPYGVTTIDFIKNCKKLLSQNGILILNFIAEKENGFKQIESILENQFETFETLLFNKNRFYICFN